MIDEAKIAEVKQLMDSDKWAEFKSIHTNGENVEVHMFIQMELAHFSGHFPEQPILAGVVQTHWACELGRTLFNIKSEFCGMENIKFSAVILPEQPLVLSLQFNRDKNSLRFSYFSGETRFSQGRVLFSELAA